MKTRCALMASPEPREVRERRGCRDRRAPRRPRATLSKVPPAVKVWPGAVRCRRPSRRFVEDSKFFIATSTLIALYGAPMPLRPIVSVGRRGPFGVLPLCAGNSAASARRCGCRVGPYRAAPEWRLCSRAQGASTASATSRGFAYAAVYASAAANPRRAGREGVSVRDGGSGQIEVSS